MAAKFERCLLETSFLKKDIATQQQKLQQLEEKNERNEQVISTQTSLIHSLQAEAIVRDQKIESLENALAEKETHKRDSIVIPRLERTMEELVYRCELLEAARKLMEEQTKGLQKDKDLEVKGLREEIESLKQIIQGLEDKSKNEVENLGSDTRAAESRGNRTETKIGSEEKKEAPTLEDIIPSEEASEVTSPREDYVPTTQSEAWKEELSTTSQFVAERAAFSIQKQKFQEEREAFIKERQYLDGEKENLNNKYKELEHIACGLDKHREALMSEKHQYQKENEIFAEQQRALHKNQQELYAREMELKENQQKLDDQQKALDEYHKERERRKGNLMQWELDLIKRRGELKHDQEKLQEWEQRVNIKERLLEEKMQKLKTKKSRKKKGASRWLASCLQLVRSRISLCLRNFPQLGRIRNWLSSSRSESESQWPEIFPTTSPSKGTLIRRDSPITAGGRTLMWRVTSCLVGWWMRSQEEKKEAPTLEDIIPSEEASEVTSPREDYVPTTQSEAWKEELSTTSQFAAERAAFSIQKQKFQEEREAFIKERQYLDGEKEKLNNKYKELEHIACGLDKHREALMSEKHQYQKENEIFAEQQRALHKNQQELYAREMELKENQQKLDDQQKALDEYHKERERRKGNLMQWELDLIKRRGELEHDQEKLREWEQRVNIKERLLEEKMQKLKTKKSRKKKGASRWLASCLQLVRSRISLCLRNFPQLGRIRNWLSPSRSESESQWPEIFPTTSPSKGTLIRRDSPITAGGRTLMWRVTSCLVGWWMRSQGERDTRGP
ncbi:golgin subfamily A member 6-like protein 25 [Macrobrachium nipponense]|uniref:golgin subfamily A member 6-like protein 25 n=1 Tax=Macrobrachium nipponense TaxID=159736 RepID=UPI0030C8913A